MDSTYEQLAKRADELNIEIHPVTIVVNIVAEDSDEANDLAERLDGSAYKHPTGDFMVRISGRAAAELGANISPWMQNESQAKLLGELHASWNESRKNE